MKRIKYIDDKVVIFKDETFLTKEKVYNDFIEENKSKESCALSYEISYSMLSHILSCFNIKKDPKKVTANAKKTFIEKYGVDNISKSNNIKEIKKQAALKKYGVENISQSSEIKEKKKQTFLDRYGVEFLLNTDKEKEKRKKKNLEQYGVEYYQQTEEYKQKLTKTIQERYGVEWACMRPEARKFSNNNSLPNLKFEKILEENKIEYEREFPINGKSYDFKVGKILIEIDPTPTHSVDWAPYSEDHRSKITEDYHLNKTLNAIENNYQCVHVWDWDNISGIINIIKESEKIFAKNTEVRIIDEKDSKDFINKNHVQFNVKSKVQIGLFYKDELVSVMTFGKPRYNKKYQWELLRYCSTKRIVGGAAKIFAFFVNNFNPENVISYCDLSKFSGEVYEKIGFSLLRKSAPTRHWYGLKNREHYTDNLIRSKGPSRIINHCEPSEDIDYGTNDNNIIMMKLGYISLYDCGQATYVWKK